MTGLLEIREGLVETISYDLHELGHYGEAFDRWCEAKGLDPTEAEAWVAFERNNLGEFVGQLNLNRIDDVEKLVLLTASALMLAFMVGYSAAEQKSMGL